MTGEADLATLLAGLRPRLSEAEFAFGMVPDGIALPPRIKPVGTFHEAEGMTVIAPAASFAETDIEHIAGWALITLEVHFAPAAVGHDRSCCSCPGRRGHQHQRGRGLLP